jgi:hypothetical protein
MKSSLCLFVAAASLAGVAGSVQGRAVDPDQKQFVKAVTAYLVDHGDLCVGKFDWPRDVTPADQQAGSNDAIQLPVLERLGLVESADVAESVKRYSLTAKGREFYLRKKLTSLGAHDQPVVHDADFCVARLSLDKVIKWSPPEPVRGHVETVVSYTYKIKPADWMADPEARRIFPVVDRIIQGEGTVLMTATLQARNGKWVPVLPGS